jgi:SSS family solute:Na+ symporter
MNDIHQHLHTLDFVIVLAYLLILIGIGYWVSFVKHKNREENLFLAGRSLGWMSIGFTMWGTNVGPSMLIASASIGYTTGIVAGNFAWYAFPFIFLLAVVFAPRYLQANVLTLPEYMGKRFGPATRSMLAWYSLVTILISWLALTLYSGGILVSQMLNFPLWLSVLLLVAIAAFFAVSGGLKAVAYTNVFQMLLLIVVSFILAAVAVWKVGGLTALYEETPAHYWNLLRPMDDANYPWLAIALGYPVMGIWFWCTDQSMVQSVLGAKDLRNGQLGANFTGWLKILDVALFIIPGIACYVLFPQLSNPDQAYMTLVTQLFPAGMTGLVMAVLIAALVSTIDGALNSLSTVFTMDIYVKHFKPAATQREIVRIGRIVAIAGAGIAVLFALAIGSIEGLNLFDVFQAILGFIAPPMSVVFLLGVLWKRTTARAVNIILTAGTLFSLGTGVLYLWVLPASAYPWPHFLLLSFYIFVVLLVAAIMISLLDKRSNHSAEPIKIQALPSRKVLMAWMALIVVMVGMYVFFNGHGD